MDNNEEPNLVVNENELTDVVIDIPTEPKAPEVVLNNTAVSEPTPITTEAVVTENTPVPEVVAPVATPTPVEPVLTIESKNPAVPAEPASPVVATPSEPVPAMTEQTIPTVASPEISEPISLTAPQAKPNVSDVVGIIPTGQPDEIDVGGEAIQNQKSEKGKKKNPLTMILIIVLALAIIGGGAYYYFFIYSANVSEPNPAISEPKDTYTGMQFDDVKIGSDFYDTYKIVDGSFRTRAYTDEVFMSVDDGIIAYQKGDINYKISITDKKIEAITHFSTIAGKGEIIGIRTESQEYYFATILDTNKADLELSKTNNNFLPIKKDLSIVSLSVGIYPSFSKDVLYIATSLDEDYVVSYKNDNVVTTPLKEVIFNGVGIDLNQAKFNKEKDKEIIIDGIEISYDKKIFSYTGKLDSIKETEIVDADGQSFNCSEAILVYDPDYKYINLYVINIKEEKQYLYKLDVLKNETVPVLQSESPLTDVTKQDTGTSKTIVFDFEDGTYINLPSE